MHRDEEPPANEVRDAGDVILLHVNALGLRDGLERVSAELPHEGREEPPHELEKPVSNAHQEEEATNPDDSVLIIVSCKRSNAFVSAQAS